ncbi:sigma-54-dependent transcriptional regulator [Candidatus Entotheonella palauensis]|nr:sigma 54-interacting transcriptional regulator [Candidatus Entotheonella palauensis]
MALLDTYERAQLQAISDVAYGNPFLPEYPERQRVVLGDDFLESQALWNMRGDDIDAPLVDPATIAARIEPLVGTLRERLAQGAPANDSVFSLYEDAVLYLLFYRYESAFYGVIARAMEAKQTTCRFYTDFLRDWTYYFHLPSQKVPTRHEAAHIFACFYQVRRAFHHIFRYVIGGSMAAAQLRAAIWQSIFTHDMRRYRRILYERMGDFNTLITGPSGTGKELVASAIGLSRYIPFDPETMTFTVNYNTIFHALNLSAMPSTLIESELFGHRRGAFTGATQHRQGWLETCHALGTIFLDEIGDLDAGVQVKLLRVLQTRMFQPLGDTVDRRFHGKLIAATNRDLAQAMEQGQFREDFYYRMCSDLVVTPSLYEQLQEAPEALYSLITFIAHRIIGPEADILAAEVTDWIHKHLGDDYPWPGNIRELEQCVRNVLIRQAYDPPKRQAQTSHDRLTQALRQCTLTADELLRHYCNLVFAQTGSYAETARRLDLDRRTVKSKIDPETMF